MTCGLMQKLLGSLLFSKIGTYLFLHNFSQLSDGNVNTQCMTIHCFIDSMLYVAIENFIFHDFCNNIEVFSTIVHLFCMPVIFCSVASVCISLKLKCMHDCYQLS